jgi:MFS family permease
MSKSFAALIISRCLGGALNGNVAVIKGTMGEITDESNQARAFSFLPLAWSLGSVIGLVQLRCSPSHSYSLLLPSLCDRPLLGGYLSHPAERFPRYFDYPFFVENPYVLPCLVGALFPLLGALVGFFFLEETLKPSTSSPSPAKVDRRSAKRHGRFVATTSTTLPAPTEQRRLLEDADDTDSGYSTPAQTSRTDLRAEINAEEMAAEGLGPIKPPPFTALFTDRVIAALVTYVCPLTFLCLCARLNEGLARLNRLSSHSRL